LQDIDPILLFQPAVAFAISLGILIYWWHTRGFRGAALLLSAGAYWIAVVIKEVINATSLGPLSSAYGYQSVEVALLLGLETVFLEIGLAYLFATYGVKRRGMNASDAVSYGIGLSFWENGVLLGVISVFNLGVIYLLLQTTSPIATTVYNQLQSSAPSLFQPPGALLPGVLLGTLERISSMMGHIAWGILVVLSAATGKKRYLAFALPMGLIDALVPWAPENIYIFEGGFFLLSLGFLALAAWSLSRAQTTVEP
jgi:hypothetical protein